MDRLRAVSFFSGAGGLDLGFEAAGIDTVFASDIDPYSCATLKAGQREAGRRRRRFFERTRVLEADIRILDASDVRNAAALGRSRPDLLLGGPPCQAFSVFGRRRGRSDPRGLLVDDYLRLLGSLRPSAFVFENVYGLLSIDGGRIFDVLCERLAHPARDLEYELSVHRVDAASYGVPQFRDRVFVIGHAFGRKVVDIPPTTRAPDSLLFRELPKYRTVRDGLRGLPPVGSSYPANHWGRKHSPRIVERYASLRAGERDPVTRINKLDLARPSFAIIVGSDAGGGKGHVHPTEPREVSPRESARMQTFPDWWAFAGNGRHSIRQVGNAVPPLLAAVVANEVRSQLFDLPKKSFLRLVGALDQGHLFKDK